MQTKSNLKMKECLTITHNGMKLLDAIESRLRYSGGRKFIRFRFFRNADQLTIEPIFAFGIRGGIKLLLYGDISKNNDIVSIHIRTRAKSLSYMVLTIVFIIFLYYNKIINVIIGSFIVITANILCFLIQAIYCLRIIRDAVRECEEE